MLTQERLRQLLEYDTETGKFWWLTTRGPVKAGYEAGHFHIAGVKIYVRMTVDYVRYYAHHLAWLYIHGYIPNEIDHWDGDGTHNWLSNLRESTRSQNNANRQTTGSKLRGAFFDHRVQRWYAKIQVDGRPIWLGHFESAEEAHVAYQCAADQFFGEFAEHNQPTLERGEP